MSTSDAAPARPLRADARRNRDRVLAAARDAFAADGLAVPLDEIARRAGVGPGTVYRHFPTKEALFEAVVVDRLAKLAERGERVLEHVVAGQDAGDAFFDFLTTLIADAFEKMDVAEALAGAGVDLRQAAPGVADTLRTVLADLLSRAQTAGAVRPDVNVVDVHALAAGAVAAERRRAPGDSPGRLVGIICDGLRPRAT